MTGPEGEAHIPSGGNAGELAMPSSAPAEAAAPRRANGWAALRSFFARLWNLPPTSEDNLFLFLAILIGLMSGLAVVCFRISIDWCRFYLLGSSLHPAASRVVIVPAAAGLAVALLVMLLFRRVRGSGVNQTKSAVYIYDGYIPFSTVIGKFVTCALAIGSGQSLGPEDPSLQIGAGLASALGRRLHFSREKMRMIAPVGAAAGLAAAFNAPIAAVIFVLEEVLSRWSAGVLGAIVLAAVSSVVVVRGLLGSQPMFSVPTYRLVHPSELFAYAALGVIGGLASLAITKLVGFLRPRLKALPRATQYFQPALAGLAIGVIGIWLPQVMGAGYDVIDQAMHDQYAWKVLALLAAFKIIATTLSFTSGTPGGMFAPALFIGAMIGGAVRGVEYFYFPHAVGSVGAYALVGMGTFFAGFLRVPMTSVFMVLELSGNYSIIVPVMVSNTIAYLISRRYQSTALFDMLAHQDGTDLPSMEEERELSPLRVEDAMRPAPAIVLNGKDSVAESLKRVDSSSEEDFLVRDSGGSWALLSKAGLQRYAAVGNAEQPVWALAADNHVASLHPDHALNIALRRMGGHPFLPVVHRADLQRLVGVISLHHIMSAYESRFWRHG